MRAGHDARAETIGGVVMYRLGRIPEVGDEVAVQGRRLRVEALDGLRVALVRLLPGPSGGAIERGLPLLVLPLLASAPELVACVV
jgi:hypothetical protein